MHIAIIGLGYVGLPLSLQFARSGVNVIGLDIDAAKNEALNQGKSYIKHITPESILEQVSAGRFTASADFSLIRQVEAIIICVPTPLNKNREPDISYIVDTGKAIAPFNKGLRRTGAMLGAVRDLDVLLEKAQAWEMTPAAGPAPGGAVQSPTKAAVARAA